MQASLNIELIEEVAVDNTDIPNRKRLKKRTHKRVQKIHSTSYTHTSHTTTHRQNTLSTVYPSTLSAKMFKKIKNAGKKKEVTIEEKSQKSSLEPANEKDPRHATTTKLESSDHSSKKERKRSKERGDKGELVVFLMIVLLFVSYLLCFVRMMLERVGHLTII